MKLVTNDYLKRLYTYAKARITDALPDFYVDCTPTQMCLNMNKGECEKNLKVFQSFSKFF